MAIALMLIAFVVVLGVAFAVQYFDYKKAQSQKDRWH